jgi:hypothetical protein
LPDVDSVPAGLKPSDQLAHPQQEARLEDAAGTGPIESRLHLMAKVGCFAVIALLVITGLGPAQRPGLLAGIGWR